jgi:N-acetylneuraminate synthase
VGGIVSTMSIAIEHLRIGGHARCFVIAEAGVNHNGDPQLARRLVDAAADAGADAVKFQTFDPATLAAPSAPKAEYQKAGSKDSADQQEMLRKLMLPAEMHADLQRHARARGLIFLSSPFDEASADFLERLGVPLFKVPSGEITNHPFLAHLARKGRPLLVSTGMCELGEVESAVAVIRASGDPPLALFHCVSNYPARPEDANLRAMATMRAAFAVPVGWSDHTLGVDVAVAAVAMGAELLEKHLTLDRELPGPDHRASLDPSEFARMIRGIRQAEAALGTGEKHPVASEAAIAAVARKSLHWRVPLAPQERVAPDHLIALRPGTGLPPYQSAKIIGRRVRTGVMQGTLVRDEDLEPTS